MREDTSHFLRFYAFFTRQQHHRGKLHRITEMRFGGIQENSMIDFPGKLACVLFVPGCNFRCPYCHNPALALNQIDGINMLTLAEAVAFLVERQGFLDGVVITGGEPTLQPSLLGACKKIKELGYPIKIDTNGSRPEVIEALFAAGVIDYIAMDVKTDPKHYIPLIRPDGDPAAILSSIQLILRSGVAHEFRTTCINPLVNLTAIETISKLVEGADLYVLQQFHTAQVLDPVYCRENTRRHDTEMLALFRSTAEPRVKRCIVR
jgi:pyruvate formate lyase activating enzyme